MRSKKLQNLLNKQKRPQVKWLRNIHHNLKKEYGMSFEEFKQLPLLAMWSLVEEMTEERKREKEDMEKMKHRRK